MARKASRQGIPTEKAKAADSLPASGNQASARQGIEMQRAGVVRLPRKTAMKAFELLAQQPASLIGLTLEQRNAVVVTAVADESGQEYVLSRFGDEVWDLSPEFEAKNRSARSMRIAWSNDVPTAMLQDAKIAVYCALRQGRSGDWSASSAVSVAKSMRQTLRYLSNLGVQNFSGVRALHITDHIAELRKSKAATTVYMRLAILDLVWSVPQEMTHPLLEHPFGGKSLYDAVGQESNMADVENGKGSTRCTGRTGKTAVIPPSVQKAIWARCEWILASAGQVLARRNAGELLAHSRELTEIRNAVLYQLQITTGMRNSDSTGVRNGCWRQEHRTMLDGRSVVLHWVRTKEVKTTGGEELDYLAPGELFASLEILQDYAAPLQRRLTDESRWLEAALSEGVHDQGLLSNSMTVSDAISRLNHVREIGQHMLLSISTSASDHLGLGSRVEVTTVESCGAALKGLARNSGVDWKLANHQCRRTFSWNVANSKLGRMALVFLKWQLKHASLSWTQLYAANPRQDQALYAEFGDAMWESKVGLIDAWHQADTRLSGGAGKKLMQTRATPAKDHRQLLEATAEVITVRSTGHAWCLSGTQGCHGQGIYDPTMCGGCSQAVIDESQGSRWQMIHLDNLRLAAITDCGPAVNAKAKRAIEMSKKVLADLDIDLPGPEQEQAYERGEWV